MKQPLLVWLWLACPVRAFELVAHHGVSRWHFTTGGPPCSAPRAAALRAASGDDGSSRSARATVTMGATALERVEEMVSKHKVFLFMKGTKIFPQCGFSNTVVQVLDRLDVEYETFDVLADAEIRQAAKDFAQWPTLPQLYVDGEFAGGSDIVIEQYESGELKKLLTGDPDAEVVETPKMNVAPEEGLGLLRIDAPTTSEGASAAVDGNGVEIAMSIDAGWMMPPEVAAGVERLAAHDAHDRRLGTQAERFKAAQTLGKDGLATQVSEPARPRPRSSPRGGVRSRSPSHLRARRVASTPF